MINICTLGSVADGKSTMVKMLTGEKTQRDSRELIRNITINAGYSNLKIWKCNNCQKKYSSGEKIGEFNCCNNNCDLIKYISFADCPGHQELITTMMSSVALMKGAIVIVSVETSLKEKPQLRQHLLAAKLANISNIIICLNKCDLQSKSIVIERYNELNDIQDPTFIKHKLRKQDEYETNGKSKIRKQNEYLNPVTQRNINRYKDSRIKKRSQYRKP